MRVEAVGPADWEAWRELRLEGLQDTPIGFMETYSDALRVTPQEWQERLGRPGLRLLAYDGERAVGMAGGFRDESDEPILFAVYVTPDARRGAVLTALVDRVAEWAAPDSLVLEVHEDNERARRAYLKLGFVEDGRRRDGGAPDGGNLLRMVRR